ncbi:MAG: GLPGLI family protein [Flavobacteriaceae bacterium]|nr:GLPGLI family protein [Flavobacteriaceae bacterium]
MKTLLYLSMVLTFLFTTLVSAQDFNGIATYKTQRKMEIAMDSTQMSSEMHQQMMAMVKKQFEREYTLNFNKNESIYKQVEQLDKPTGVGNGGMQIVVAGSGDSDVLYKNTKEDYFLNQNELFSKQFLINDSLELPEWNLEKETKNIGNYTCFKATYTRMVPEERMGPPSEEGEEVAEVEETVTAWYTLQIPIKQGPGMYYGLPGLILEVSAGNQSILCSKIVLNPKDGISITKPTKGKKVNQEEYDVIMEKKMREMSERMNSNRRDDGNSIEIRIGG